MAEIQIAYEIERSDYAEANAAVHTAARKWYLDLSKLKLLPDRIGPDMRRRWCLRLLGDK
jgi:hypothetical protein